MKKIIISSAVLLFIVSSGFYLTDKIPALMSKLFVDKVISELSSEQYVPEFGNLVFIKEQSAYDIASDKSYDYIEEAKCFIDKYPEKTIQVINEYDDYFWEELEKAYSEDADKDADIYILNLRQLLEEQADILIGYSKLTPYEENVLLIRTETFLDAEVYGDDVLLHKSMKNICLFLNNHNIKVKYTDDHYEFYSTPQIYWAFCLYRHKGELTMAQRAEIYARMINEGLE
ncbi:MAG: hypothetical protein K8R54_15755 [Bacteroidales bacterium]|nr:hypothetical protein [Bacteroidales bacterium]